MAVLPLLPATVIGSWSLPGWYAKFCEDVARQPELFGADDRDEAIRDAVLEKNAAEYGLENLQFDPALDYDTVELTSPTSMALGRAGLSNGPR